MFDLETFQTKSSWIFNNSHTSLIPYNISPSHSLASLNSHPPSQSPIQTSHLRHFLTLLNTLYNILLMNQEGVQSNDCVGALVVRRFFLNEIIS